VRPGRRDPRGVPARARLDVARAGTRRRTELAVLADPQRTYARFAAFVRMLGALVIVSMRRCACSCLVDVTSTRTGSDVLAAAEGQMGDTGSNGAPRDVPQGQIMSKCSPSPFSPLVFESSQVNGSLFVFVSEFESWRVGRA
jgi:hypothetical protein